MYLLTNTTEQKMSFNNYQDMIDSNDIDALVQHAIEGVEENNHVNGANTSDWESGFDIAFIYLDDSKLWNSSPEAREQITAKLQRWIDSQ